MAGRPGRDALVGRVAKGAAGVADRGFDHTRHLPKCLFDAPETAGREGSDADQPVAAIADRRSRKKDAHACALVRAWSSSQAEVISPMWLNACGKFPRSSPCSASI